MQNANKKKITGAVALAAAGVMALGGVSMPMMPKILSRIRFCTGQGTGISTCVTISEAALLNMAFLIFRETTTSIPARLFPFMVTILEAMRRQCSHRL